MQATYAEALDKVFEDEGGYTNDAQDKGGPTNWGITIHDARMYWKADATAGDVRRMPKAVAVDIYLKRYANPLKYDQLPAGVDYAVLDYGINSGIARSAMVLQRLVGATDDGKIGPLTLAAVAKWIDAHSRGELVNAIYNERLAFLQRLSIWPTFGRGWTRRCREGRALALKMVREH